MLDEELRQQIANGAIVIDNQKMWRWHHFDSYPIPIARQSPRFVNDCCMTLRRCNRKPNRGRMDIFRKLMARTLVIPGLPRANNKEKLP
jgi:hypothetical protein